MLPEVQTLSAIEIMIFTKYYVLRDVCIGFPLISHLKGVKEISVTGMTNIVQ